MHSGEGQLGQVVPGECGTVGDWIPGHDATPSLETHTHVQRLLGTAAGNQSRISDFPQLAFAVMPCTHL